MPTSCGVSIHPTPTKRRTRPPLRKIELKKFDWPDEVDAATRAAAEEHLENMVEIGGRDGRDAEDWFRQQGRKICGRLISEFPVIVERYGMEREGMMRLMVLDRVLSSLSVVASGGGPDLLPVERIAVGTSGDLDGDGDDEVILGPVVEGATPDDAFRVQCGMPQTMSMEDIANGRLNVEIAIAPVRPAEFVVFRVYQKTQEAKS